MRASAKDVAELNKVAAKNINIQKLISQYKDAVGGRKILNGRMWIFLLMFAQSTFFLLEFPLTVPLSLLRSTSGDS